MRYTLLIIAIVIFIHCDCIAQKPSNLELIFSQDLKIENTTSSKPETKRNRIVPYLFKPGYFLFKHTVYNQMGLTCVFKKPCMDFCGDLIGKYGIVKGYFISFDRVVRCNRLTPLETYPTSLSFEGKIIDVVMDYQNRNP